MAKITYRTPESGVSLPWVGDELNREHIVPGGTMLDAASFSANADGRRYVESGSLVGRSYSERDAGEGFGPAALPAADGTGGDDEVYLLLYDVWDADDNPEAALYRPASLVYEDKLPADTDLAAVRARYETLAS